MTNGNDLLEFEQEHIEELEQEFLLMYSKEFVKFVNDASDWFESVNDIVASFKDFNTDKWNTHVMEMYDNSMIQ